jgi:hypothetical protein
MEEFMRGTKQAKEMKRRASQHRAWWAGSSLETDDRYGGADLASGQIDLG